MTLTLHREPVRLGEATTQVRDRPGVYSWWSVPDVPAGLTRRQVHPLVMDLALLYVGVGVDLQARMVGKHLRGSTGSSTLRKTLASLLLPSEGWKTRWTTTRVVLTPTAEASLTAWMREHLWVTWAETRAFDDVEPALIRALEPPLNLDHNRGHPDRPTVRAARRAFVASAGPRP